MTRRSLDAVLCLALAACGSDAAKGDPAGDAPDAATPDGGLPEGAPDYADPAMWMCKPGAANDVCTSTDLTATEVRSDGTFAALAFPPAEDPPFDCFYVHPTQAFDPGPGNVLDPELPLYALRNQAARFVSLCRMFAPYYRQMTLDSYGAAENYEATEYFATAYGDVRRAFDHYMAHDNQGRPFVLLGHSQGTHMLVPLLKERFDGDQPERAQLISALLIGPVGRVAVPAGKLVGGTFEKLPLCSETGQRGCVVSYDARVEGDEASFGPSRWIGEGMEWACVNPALLADGDELITSSIWPVDGGIPFPDEALSHPFVAYPEAYTARCEADGSLGIAARPSDPRSPIDPALIQAGLSSMNLGTSLHVVDYAFVLGDLLRIVAAQAAAK
jgi:hypothetical protein